MASLMYQKVSCSSWPVPAIAFHSASGPYSTTGAKKNSRELRNSSENSSISTRGSSPAARSQASQSSTVG